MTTAEPGEYPKKNVGVLEVNLGAYQIDIDTQFKVSYLGNEHTTIESVFAPQGQIYYVKAYQNLRNYGKENRIAWVIGYKKEGKKYLKFMTEKAEKKGEFGEISFVKEWQMYHGYVGFHLHEDHVVYIWIYDGKAGNVKICRADSNFPDIWNEENYETECITYKDAKLALLLLASLMTLTFNLKTNNHQIGYPSPQSSKGTKLQIILNWKD
jgi:hypothetical protein